MRLHQVLSIVAVSIACVHALAYPALLAGIHARNQVSHPSDPIERTSVHGGQTMTFTDTSTDTATNQTTSSTTTSAAASSSMSHGYHYQIPTLLVAGTLLLSWL
ncbi:hypothetical protein Cantr_07212 [Candida viswanathii]|uniref:Uncharacterized protein n=1 Tax=Candida viswanathii TaxID=5486 RepID=A0A367XZJ6_9ASCO|nr:hypothetical protein Cantr_07212 [Candida viswanathii]